MRSVATVGRRSLVAGRRLRYVIIGLGNIGQKRLTALGSACISTVDPFNPSADHQQLGAVPTCAYDAAILCVPNDVKPSLMRSLLAQGKSVMVEKPLVFADDDEALQLGRLAEAHDAIWYTAYNHRFEPLIAIAKGWLDDGRIGQVYTARLFYGNGTVSNVVGSFRDRGLGVIEDLGSHLLDLSAWLFGAAEPAFTAVSVQRQEASAPDHAILRSRDGQITLEMSFLSWKNTFTIDVLGSGGSLHLNGLRKWGSSELILRQRVFPSGVPIETRLESSGPDETWADEILHFEKRARERHSSFENDRWISQVLRGLA